MGGVGQAGGQDTIGGMIFFGGHGPSGMMNGCQMHHMVDVLENGFEVYVNYPRCLTPPFPS